MQHQIFNSIHKDCEVNYYTTDANRPHKKTAIFELLLKATAMEKEQNLYEVTELQEYNEKREYQQFRDNRKRKKQSFTVPCCFFGIIVIVSILLIIGLLIAVLVSENLNQDSTSDNVQMTKPNEGVNSTSDGSCMSGPTSSPTTSLPNCSIVHTEWANEIQAEMDQLKRLIQTQFSNLINKSEESASKIDDIRTFTDIQTEKCLNNSEDIKNILEITEKSAAKLMNIVNTLSNLQDTSTSTNGVVDDILLVVQELLVLHNDSTTLPTSCKEVKERQPNSPSGVYLLVTPNGGGNTYTAYCNMDELCGSGGGWTRVSHLDMSDSSQNCPSGFTLYQLGSVRACSRPSGGGNCASVKFPSNGISYSHVCGRVTGYQYGTPDAVNPHVNNINSYYLDGVSITHHLVNTFGAFTVV